MNRGELLLLGVLACGGSNPQAEDPLAKDAWREPSNEKADRTVDQWTDDDENRYMAMACRNIVAPDGTLRCPALGRAGLRADHCLESFTAIRDAARQQQQVFAFRLIVAGLWNAISCTEVDATFRIAALAAQHPAPK